MRYRAQRLESNRRGGSTQRGNVGRDRIRTPMGLEKSRGKLSAGSKAILVCQKTHFFSLVSLGGENDINSWSRTGSKGNQGFRGGVTKGEGGGEKTQSLTAYLSKEEAGRSQKRRNGSVTPPLGDIGETLRGFKRPKGTGSRPRGRGQRHYGGGDRVTGSKVFTPSVGGEMLGTERGVQTGRGNGPLWQRVHAQTGYLRAQCPRHGRKSLRHGEGPRHPVRKYAWEEGNPNRHQQSGEKQVEPTAGTIDTQ